MFYLGGILLGLIAAAFACWPLLTRKQVRRHDSLQHDQIVRDVYRERLMELESESEDPLLQREIEHELSAVLLTEEQSSDHVAETHSTSSRAGVWVVSGLIPVCGLLLYIAVADPALEKIRGAEEVLSLTAQNDVALQSWALRLAERTQAAPDDTKSWYLLGHAYLKLRRYAPAAEAFATASSLSGEDTNIQVYWLQARYLAAGGLLDEVSRSLANKLLEQQPNMSVVLEILAMDTFRRGDGEQSISLLNRAVTGSGDVRQQASFAIAIKQVRESLAQPPPGVTVAVSTTSQVPPHATIFVIARPPGGGMPYAVVKRPAFLVPFTVRLDDLVSMSATRKLSETENFEVVVRLSASGMAMAQAGDWQWQSSPLSNISTGLSSLEAILTPPG